MRLDDLARAHTLASELKDIKESQEKVRTSNQPTYYITAPVSGPKNLACGVTRIEMAAFLFDCAGRRVAALQALGVEAT